MNFKKRIKFLYIKLREPVFGFIGAGFLGTSLLLYRLGSLVPGLSASEVSTKVQSKSLPDIIADPVFLPYKTLQWFLQYIKHYNLTTTRLISTVFAALFIALIFYILNKWYTLRVAIIGSILFGTSAWFLHFARFADPSITYVSVIGLVAYGTWIKYTNHHDLALLFGVSFAMYLLYIPGMVWYLLLGIIWQRKIIYQLIKNASNVSVFASLIFFVLILPLGWGIYQSPIIIRELLGIPSTIPGVSEIFNNVVSIPKQLFISGPSTPETWLDNLPLLNVFLIAMLIIGSYASFLRSRLDRSKTLFGAIVLATILIALNGSTFMLLLLPIVYLVVSGGIALMLQRWFKVFPRNPVARTIGTAMVIIALSVSVAYDLKHYFVAWPSTPKTKITFTKRP